MSVVRGTVFSETEEVAGRYAVRGRVMAAANERTGYTGEFPVRADRPYPGDRRDE